MNKFLFNAVSFSIYQEKFAMLIFFSQNDEVIYISICALFVCVLKNLKHYSYESSSTDQNTMSKWQFKWY